MDKSVIALLCVFPFTLITVIGGFTVDDWVQLGGAMSLRAHILGWQELWAYRPVSWVAIPSIVHILHDNYRLITICHLSLLAFSFRRIVLWSKFQFDSGQRRLALLLLFYPAIASTVTFSVINQLSASMSLMFFSIGLYADDFLNAKWFRIATVNVFFLISLLTYEISAPLILTYAFTRLNQRKRVTYEFLVLLCTFAISLFWQKVLAPELFDSVFSRANSFNLLTGLTFFYATVISFPISLVLTAISVPVGVLAVFLVIRKVVGEIGNGPTSSFVNKKYVFIFGLFSSSALFILSGSSARLYGYQNRGMTGTWILISLFLVSLVTSKSRVVKIVVLLVVASNAILFLQKIFESGNAVNLREYVVEQILDESEVPREGSAALVLDLPCHVPKSRFSSEVFCTSWDAFGAFRARGLHFTSVNVTEDRGMFNYGEALIGSESVYLATFDDQFNLVGIRKILASSSASLLAELRTTTRFGQLGEPLETCKSEFRNILKIRFPGELGILVKCLKDPFSS